MNFAEVVFFMYLLFPVVTPLQRQIAYAFGKPELTQKEEDEKITGIRVYLGLERAKTEAADQTELPVDSGEADVPLPGGLENPEFGPQSEGSVLAQEGNVAADAAEKQYVNSQNRLRLFEYGEEQLSFNQTAQGQRSIVSVNKDVVTRRQYDDAYHILNTIVWKNGATTKGSIIVKKITYTYPQNEKIANDAKPVFVVEERPVEKKLMETTFDSSGNPVLVVYSHFEDDKDAVVAKKDDGSDEVLPQKKVIDKKTARSFNAENKLLAEEETVYYEENDPLRYGKKRPATVTRKNVYAYTLKSDVPDFKFYENNVLRMATVYHNKDEYENTMYFDGGYVVKATYAHGRKIMEILYQNGSELKRQKFE